MRRLFAFALCALAAPVMAQDMDEGERLFRNHCAACHGGDARGDGPMAGVLLIEPSDLTTLSSRYDGVFPIERVVMRIDGRDPLVSHGSEMPVYGWFFEGEDTAIKTATGQPVLTSKPIVDLLTWLQQVQD